jgi:hypothetical protein
MSDRDRRFTDREVAAVLKKAAEIDEGVGSASASGLAMSDLEDIAREVGISSDALSAAVARVEQGSIREPNRVISGAPASHKAVHAVQGELNEAALNQLLHLVDERMESAGAITEALGSVRWTSSDRFASTQVTLTPQDGETTIQVSEKLIPRWKRVLHGIPTAWGAIIGMAVAGRGAVPGETIALAIAIGAVLGLGAGRVAWTFLSQRSEKRVQRLAADLSREAYNASKTGMVTTGALESGVEVEVEVDAKADAGSEIGVDPSAT